MAEVEEIKFYLSEDAGIESLQKSAKRLQKVVKALPVSVSAAGLTPSRTERADSSIQSLTTDW